MGCVGVGDKGRDNPGKANPRGRGTMAVASLRAGNYIKSHLTFPCPLIASYYSFTARFYCPATIVLIGLFRSPTAASVRRWAGNEMPHEISIRSPPPLVFLRNCRGTRFRHADLSIWISSRRLGGREEEDWDLRGRLTRSRINDEIIVWESVGAMELNRRRNRRERGCRVTVHRVFLPGSRAMM